jgi:SAM-dependent methyltransferase
MKYNALANYLPGFLRRHVLHFETAIQDRVAEFAQSLAAGTRLLDAGAGEGQYAVLFGRQRYCGVDLAVGDSGWNYSRLDALADLAALPFAADCFDAAIHIVTLEHVPEPAAVLREVARTLAPGGQLLLVAPHEWEVHQAPHDYFRYTRHGLEYLLRKAGFRSIEIEPVGGYFRLLSRRLLNGLQFFSGGMKWICFLPAAVFLVPPALVLPFLDFLDRDRNFTLGYICTARKTGA